jgi:hypothetical protein
VILANIVLGRFSGMTRQSWCVTNSGGGDGLVAVTVIKRRGVCVEMNGFAIRAVGVVAPPYDTDGSERHMYGSHNLAIWLGGRNGR